MSITKVEKKDFLDGKRGLEYNRDNGRDYYRGPGIYELGRKKTEL